MVYLKEKLNCVKKRVGKIPFGMKYENVVRHYIVFKKENLKNL